MSAADLSECTPLTHLSGKEQCWNGRWKPAIVLEERGGCVWNLKLPVRGKKPACSVLNKLYALCDGNPPNVQKVWPDQTEKLRQEASMFCFSINSMPYVMATLGMLRRSGQSELKSCVHLTEGSAHFVFGHLTAAECAVPSGLAHRLCCNKRAVRICVAGGFNCTKGDPSLVAVDTAFAYHINYSLSLATRHPVQCRPNMRVADSATVWVCKCLQLIYLSALHLTLVDIYTVYTEIASA